MLKIVKNEILTYSLYEKNVKELNEKYKSLKIATCGKSILGKDIFIFNLQNDCRVVPYITNNNTCDEASGITDGATCGAEILKNKFKITYY